MDRDSIQQPQASGHVGLFKALERDGFVVLQDLIAASECGQLAELAQAAAGDRAGSRRLLELSPVRALVDRLGENVRLASLLPPGARALQATAFVKGPDRSWGVPLHQDLSMPVERRLDARGWGGWSRKEGQLFGQPPRAVLEKLLSVRLQLDSDVADSGPLEVVAGSHRGGRLEAESISRLERATGATAIAPERGGALVMRPLLLHGSRRARRPELSRRVLHLLFGPAQLAGSEFG